MQKYVPPGDRLAVALLERPGSPSSAIASHPLRLLVQGHARSTVVRFPLTHRISSPCQSNVWQAKIKLDSFKQSSVISTLGRGSGALSGDASIESGEVEQAKPHSRFSTTLLLPIP